MQVTRYIERYGFRRWYERQLYESHAYLVVGLIGLILMLAGVEVLGTAESGVHYALLLATAASGGLGTFVAWHRFSTLLARAEHFGEAATCPRCSAWGKFNVLAQESATVNDPPEAGRPHWIKVRCKNCEAEWRVE